jgi:hypothetical protein
VSDCTCKVIILPKSLVGYFVSRLKEFRLLDPIDFVLRWAIGADRAVPTRLDQHADKGVESLAKGKKTSLNIRNTSPSEGV